MLISSQGAKSLAISMTFYYNSLKMYHETVSSSWEWTNTQKKNKPQKWRGREEYGKCLWQHAFYTCEWIINSFPELLLQKPRLLRIDAGLNYTYKSHWRAWRMWHCTICPFSIESKPQGNTRANKHPSDEEAYQIWAANMDHLLGKGCRNS